MADHIVAYLDYENCFSQITQPQLKVMNSKMFYHEQNYTKYVAKIVVGTPKYSDNNKCIKQNK